MVDSKIDSRDAARTAAWILFIAIVVGAASGMATWLFILADRLGLQFFWQQLPSMLAGVPTWAVSLGVVAVTTLAATLTVVLAGGRPFDMGGSEEAYNTHGRIDYRHLLSGTLFSLFSLFSGAPIGPEAPLTDINGGLGTFLAERFGLTGDQLKIIAYAGVAGAFSAFFGAAPVGALLAIELMSPRSQTISRNMIVAGLASGATAWVVYDLLGGEKVSAILTFPAYPHVRVVDLALAVALGVVGGLLGLIYGGGLAKLRMATQKLRTRPWLAGLAGGAVVAATSLIAPSLLFSGQAQVDTLLTDAATIGALTLILLGVGKLAISGWSLSTGYFGGPIFPLIFAGTSFGLAICLLFPAIPQPVGALGLTTGMVVVAAVAPLSVTVFLSLLAGPNMTSVIAIAAVSAWVVRQLIAPTLPGVYRAPGAEQGRAESSESS
ncbi:MAG: chloride channel protein [Coriobacteriia bacterium]|jgi:H+/Cl- antiporter ClcA|nr:chloride channel protein [Coriobacteriia bacterium]